MRKIGLVGGLSWVSTLDYYRYVNEGVNAALGGLEFAECLVYSVNFNAIQRHGWDDWDNTFAVLLSAGQSLKAGGAEAIVLCANTAHMCAERLQAALALPVIHIAEATARRVAEQGCRPVASLGTRYTMELTFFHEVLQAHGIRALTPARQETRDFIQHTLKEELGRGLTLPATRTAYLEIIDELLARGAQGVVFGCTELPLLLSPADIAVPVFDTTRLHAEAAVDFALGRAGR